MSLSTTAAVGIAVANSSLVFFLAGVLAGVLVYHCINKYQLESSKPESSSQPQHQAGPVYEEVPASIEDKIELRENMAYGPMKR